MTHRVYSVGFTLLILFALNMGLTACTSTATQRGLTTPAALAPAEIVGASNQNCAGDIASPSLAPGWKLLWQKTFEQPIARPPVADGTQVFVIERNDVPAENPSQYKDTLWALNSQTSEAQWKMGDPQAPRQIMNFMLSPKYIASLVRKYNSSSEPSLPPISEYTIISDRDSGRVLRELGVGVEALSDEALYHRSFGRALNRIDLPSGAARWYVQDAAESWGALFVDQNNLYAIGFNGNVYQYDPSDGRLIATSALGTTLAVYDFVAQGDLAIVRSGQGSANITAFDLRNMRTRWTTPVSYPSLKKSIAFWDVRVTFTVIPEAVYVYDAQNTLLKIDLLTGQVMWRIPSPEAEPMSPPVGASGLVYSLFADGTVRAFSAADGSSIGTVMKVPTWYWYWTNGARDWRDRVGGLAVADNTLIVTTGCRSVYAIQRDK